MTASPPITVRQARTQYFAASNFGPDGGYNDTWVDFHLGPIPFPFPNTPMRVRAVRYHDLHHIVTGYATDLAGELEIAAWEIGAGCGSYLVPWQLNLGGMAVGALFMPRRVLRAFARGRRSRSLYGMEFEPLLDLSVPALQRLSLGAAAKPVITAADYAWLVPAVLAGAAIALLSVAAGLVTLPLGLAAQLWRRRQLRKSMAGTAV